MSPKSGGARSTPRAEEPAAPIYKRLPCGPHSLDARGVSLHQRARLHGAMIEAVGRNGWEHVSVKDVITLAAVSRRSFYEQFANREDCFLATIDLTAGRLLERARLTYREAQGDSRDRLRAALAQLAQSAVAERKATLFVLEHSDAAGIAGRRRLLGAIAQGEGMLGAALSAGTGEPAFPVPVVRAIAGGICAILALRLREGKPTTLASELTEWTLAQTAPRSGEAPGRLAELLREQMRRRAGPGAVRRAETPPSARERLLDSAMRAAGEGRAGQLSAIEIADGAQMPIEAFFELFDDGAQCLRVAFTEAGREIADIAAVATTGESPRSTTPSLAALLEHLAAHPDRAHALAGAALCGVDSASHQSRELACRLAATLPFGPDAASFLRAATVGALIHTIRVHQLQDRVELLPAVAEQIGYVALAPLLGARQAIEALAGTD